MLTENTKTTLKIHILMSKLLCYHFHIHSNTDRVPRTHAASYGRYCNGYTI